MFALIKTYVKQLACPHRDSKFERNTHGFVDIEENNYKRSIWICNSCRKVLKSDLFIPWQDILYTHTGKHQVEFLPVSFGDASDVCMSKEGAVVLALVSLKSSGIVREISYDDLSRPMGMIALSSFYQNRRFLIPMKYKG